MCRQALWAHLVDEYEKRTPRSRAHFRRALLRQVRGGSHTLRLFEPYPFYDVACSGGRVEDLDGNHYVDFWQGHFANILGHNPPLVTEALAGKLARGQGLHTGFPNSLQLELAEEICRRTECDKVRFSTSGALVTLYAVMLSRSFTGRTLALKISGGWHGGQPYLLKGVTTYDQGLKWPESAGLHPSAADEIITTRFNDIELLEETFRRFGDRLACFILEPFLGEGGFLFAEKRYLQRARDLTKEYGAVLVFDEIISGFRFHPALLGALYGIQPDLTALGKIIGGGMPLCALAGRSDILDLCDPKAGARRVRFEGGTFSVHPSALSAGLVMLRHLAEHEPEIYPRIARLAGRVRREVPPIFERFGIPCVCTGEPVPEAPGSSMAAIQFPREAARKVIHSEDTWNAQVCDFELREKYFRLALVSRGFHTVHAFGSICTAHSDADVDAFLNAAEDAARLFSRFLPLAPETN